MAEWSVCETFTERSSLLKFRCDERGTRREGVRRKKKLPRTMNKLKPVHRYQLQNQNQIDPRREIV